jgi:Arc/MetJ-type ribon-helix-helix transcriptional regulator
MPDKIDNLNENDGKVILPMEYIEKIDRIVKTGLSVYPSREEFIKSAVEIKLAELKRGVGSK